MNYGDMQAANILSHPRENRMTRLRTTLASILLFSLTVASPALSQQNGTTIQGRQKGEVAPVEQQNIEILLDYREQMRELVQRISAYAKSQRPNFVVIVKGSTELLKKIDDIDETKTFPARAFMRSIDGIIIDGLSFGEKTLGVPTPPEKLERKLQLVRLAKKNRLNVMVIDYVQDAKQAKTSYAFNEELGLTPFAAGAMGEELNAIPTFRKYPYKENPKSIISMADVKNFLYLGDTSGFGRQDEFALKIHDTNYDLIAVNIMHGRTPLSRQAVETLKYKKLGSKRLVLAHADIGSAATYDYFWQDGWREGSPSWIASPLRDNPDRYHVQYWRQEWQNLLFGDTNSYIYGLIAQGFDGVILTGLEAQKFFIGGDNAGEETQ